MLGMGKNLGLTTYNPNGMGPEKLSPETANLAEEEVRRILQVSDT